MVSIGNRPLLTAKALRLSTALQAALEQRGQTFVGVQPVDAGFVAIASAPMGVRSEALGPTPGLAMANLERVLSAR